MGEKLAAKHKNSLSLNEKLLNGSKKTQSSSEQSLPFQLILFPIFTCCLFLSYWIILCPILYNLLYKNERSTGTSHASNISPFLYWIIALLIWLLIMSILIIIWRSLKSRYNTGKNSETYGSSGYAAPSAFSMNTKSPYAENVKLCSIKTKDFADEYSDTKQPVVTEYKKGTDKKSDEIDSNDVKAQKDLAHLVIHRHMSGNDIENTGIVNVEGKTDENKDCAESELQEITETFIKRESMKDYLKLVTVNSVDEEAKGSKSPKTPLSPRELFFIDLIKEAEKAERMKSNNDSKQAENRYFFPGDFSIPENLDKLKNTNVECGSKDPSGIETDDTKAESSYFIANVQTPTSAKTEVFLEIKPEPETSKEWILDSCKEKPILVLKQNSELKDNIPEQNVTI